MWEPLINLSQLSLQILTLEIVVYYEWYTTSAILLDWNSPCRGERVSHQEVSTRVRQREELNWASQLKSSDQQIFSRISGTDSSLTVRLYVGSPFSDCPPFGCGLDGSRG